ncbi:hypothetical protein BR93DRAFT_969617 [Coniochaeta sp. PMI_546]|nr:hypothetical protein BR93DRAFT_969617 [Coniochaeta sp. PMI_546]
MFDVAPQVDRNTLHRNVLNEILHGLPEYVLNAILNSSSGRPQDDQPATSDVTEGNDQPGSSPKEETPTTGDTAQRSSQADNTQVDDPATSDPPDNTGNAEDLPQDDPTPSHTPGSSGDAEVSQQDDPTTYSTPEGSDDEKLLRDNKLATPEASESSSDAKDAPEEETVTSDAPKHGGHEDNEQVEKPTAPDVPQDPIQPESLESTDKCSSNEAVSEEQSPSHDDTGGAKSPTEHQPLITMVSEVFDGLKEGVMEKWKHLNKIVQAYEEEIQRRWSNKSRSKRKSLLQKLWPEIPKTHQPGLGGRDPVTGAPDDALKTRADYLWPHLNLDDLSQYEPMVLMLNSRGRHHPLVFAMVDLESTALGAIDGAVYVEPEYTDIDGYSVAFCDQDNYARVCRIQNMTNDPDLDLATLLHVMKRMRYVTVGDAVVILGVQKKLYEFLVDVVREILPDKPTDIETLSSASTPVLPEPPSPSANNNETGVKHLAVTVLEAPYRVPGTMDLTYMMSLVLSMRNFAENHLWALRDDPGYFTDMLLD